MIPKNIHYCWFGGNKLPPLYMRCIDSWSQYLPGYKLYRWDESNIELNDPFIKYHLKHKNWAFVSDYVRLKKLFEYGGIYLDTDIEIVRSFDDLLSNTVFLGEEDVNRVNTAVLGSIVGSSFIKYCYETMAARHQANEAFLIAPELASYAIKNYNGNENITVLDFDAFYPYNPYRSSSLDVLMYSDIKQGTFAIHHWGKSWNEGFFHNVIRKIKFLIGG